MGCKLFYNSNVFADSDGFRSRSFVSWINSSNQNNNIVETILSALKFCCFELYAV